MLRTLIIMLILIIITVLIYNNNSTKERFTNDLFNEMDIYVINLKSRIDKKNYMITQLNNRNLDAKIFEAVDGKKLDLNALANEGIIDQDENRRLNKRQLRRGEIGCALSHIIIWLEFLKSDKNYALIFEDDAILNNDFKNKLIDVINEANTTSWEILYLNENCYRHFGKKCNGPSVTNKIIRPNNLGYGLYGYIIKKDAVQKYMNNIMPFIIPIDDYLLHKQMDSDNYILRLKDPIVEVNKRFSSDTVGIK